MIPDTYCWGIGLLSWAGRNADRGIRLLGYVVFFAFCLHYWLKAFGL